MDAEDQQSYNESANVGSTNEWQKIVVEFNSGDTHIFHMDDSKVNALLHIWNNGRSDPICFYGVSLKEKDGDAELFTSAELEYEFGDGFLDEKWSRYAPSGNADYSQVSKANLIMLFGTLPRDPSDTVDQGDPNEGFITSGLIAIGEEGMGTIQTVASTVPGSKYTVSVWVRGNGDPQITERDNLGSGKPNIGLAETIIYPDKWTLAT